MKTWLAAGAAATGALAARDYMQREHTILRNFPVVGHARYLIERFGPELRQYIVADNNEERPFSRDQRRWVYASAKGQNAYFGFGSDNNFERNDGYVAIKHRTFAERPRAGAAEARETDTEGIHELACAKVMGAARGRREAFRPRSIVNISGMSFGSLSGAAVRALNQGAAAAGCMQNTGEGGLSGHHKHGGDIVFQIGTAYFGCRDDAGNFDLDKLKQVVASGPVRAIEIKLSQGAKPGLGGLLPAAKVTEEIAAARSIVLGEDCASPSRHTAFNDVDSMLDFVELIADETGLPVGIKSAVGELGFWDELTAEMARGERGVDFVNIDGGEGGTGASPLIFSDSIAYPFRIAFTEVYKRFAAAGIADNVVFGGAGKLGVPENAIVAMALGVDLIWVAREPMMSIGCIQAQKCHTDNCPVGVATQNPRYVRGLDVESKSGRAANYIASVRAELIKVTDALGLAHPCEIDGDDVDIIDNTRAHQALREVFGYERGWGGFKYAG